MFTLPFRMDKPSHFCLLLFDASAHEMLPGKTASVLKSDYVIVSPVMDIPRSGLHNGSPSENSRLESQRSAARLLAANSAGVNNQLLTGPAKFDIQQQSVRSRPRRPSPED